MDRPATSGDYRKVKVGNKIYQFMPPEFERGIADWRNCLLICNTIILIKLYFYKMVHMVIIININIRLENKNMR